MKYRNQNVIACPHCGEEQEGKAHEYVISSGRIGPLSGATEECWECNVKFYVERYGHDHIEVSADTPDYG